MQTKENPKVSVIMNCLNCEKYLKEAIDSVYAQTYKDWEIIFWDNASTDSSAEIAKSYDEKLRYFRGEETIPLGAARNKALEQAKGEFIAFLDCDDIWMPEKLEKQIPLFKDPAVGLVYSDVINFNEKGKKTRLYSMHRFCTGKCFSELLMAYFLSIQTVVIRDVALYGENMWFDKRFNMIEEADLFRRIAYKWKLSMVNEPLAKYRVHLNSLTWTIGHIALEETSLMLANYHKMYPEFGRRFRKEIYILERSLHIRKASYLWKRGDAKNARNCLARYLFSSARVLILFVLTFFPEHVVSPFLDRLRRLRQVQGITPF